MPGHSAILPASTIQQWEEEIAAMKPRKAKKWKTHLTNIHGQDTIVRHVPNGIQTRYYGVVYFEVKASDIDKRGAPVGAVIPDWIPIVSDVAARAYANNKDDPFEVAIQDGTLEEHLEAAIRENHTGKHKSRNHPVRVPTRAGEPVRG